ncbi:MAG: hypothetical protein C4519_03305 [Desulfobacteraceae bacterium]|nr:MAG: hypothetical protein C4519_03305 [Desulfobacteraceae bacterium]
MTERAAGGVLSGLLRWGLVCFAFLLVACSQVRPYGLIYTNIRLPLTQNLHNTPFPGLAPDSGRVFEVKEPFTGIGVYARLSSNAIGDIAKGNGLQTLYFADQEIFSILGVWKTHRTILYGE